MRSVGSPFRAHPSNRLRQHMRRTASGSAAIESTVGLVIGIVYRRIERLEEVVAKSKSFGLPRA